MRKLWILLLFVHLNANAYDTSTPHPYEIPFLPPYCKYKLSGKYTSPDAIKWAKLLGDTFAHVHHYCWALAYVSRAHRIIGNEADKMLQLDQALGNFRYVLEHSPQDSQLAPEIYTQKGKTLASMHRIGEAFQDFNEAIRLNPKYIGSYLAASDLYLKIDRPEDAKKIVQQGLKQLPNSKGLQQRLKKLNE